MTVETVGRYLQTCRRQRGVALTALATRLCPLNILAAIEQGQQTPSVAQLTQIYRQLGITRNQPLPQTYPILRLPAFNQQLQSWWQNQKYSELVANIAAGDVLQRLTTDTDRQAILYYYGRALAAIGDFDSAQLHLRAGLMFMTPQHPTRYRSLDLLLMAAENAVRVQTLGVPTFTGFEEAVAIMQQERVGDQLDNLPLVYYQYGQSLLHANQPGRASQVLQAGIQWSQAHQVTYLLPDCYLLLALAVRMTQQISLEKR